MSNKLTDNAEKRSGFASKMGSILANVVVGCVSACLVAICIALTYRFIVWLL